uniref:Mating-type protein MAT1-1-1 n=2 Tax=Thielaviopsis TaxID=60496 RepID=A0A2R4ZPZ7_9PEZI|nr:mating-type protein MAT1-1-1 [Thielaviopsis euricoi]DAB41624.1 TPA_exp: mating-type protein MAT1-1-1 [Thielaviopsis paradoxa]
MSSQTVDVIPQQGHPSAAECENVDLMELLQTLSNEQILRLIPRSAVKNLHHISHLIRSGDFDPNSITLSPLDDIISRSVSPTESQFSGSSTPTLVPDTPRQAYAESFNQESPSTPQESSDDEKVRRPLNGFIAFRAYYQKMFTHLPQKNISTFITQLWKSDPFQSRWMLIGRLYSFVRDTIGKSNTKLSEFLQVAAPVMCTPSPEEYLTKLCWVMSSTDDYDVTFVQDHVGLRKYLHDAKSIFAPTSEQELLNHCIVRGYLPDFSDSLLTKLAQNNNVVTVQERSSKKRPYTEMVYQQSFTINRDITTSPDTRAEFRMKMKRLSGETCISPVTAEPLYQAPPPAMQYADPVWFNLPTQPPPAQFKLSALEEQDQAFNIFLSSQQLYDITDPFQGDAIAF